MRIHFSKYQGTGNDFIMVDNRKETFPAGVDIRRLCDRRFGIGADGFILMEQKKDELYMRYYNADGGLSTMCGNGGRCFAAFARKSGVPGNEIRFRAADGMHNAVFTGEQPIRVRLSMSDVSGIEMGESFLFLDTGSPHVVKFTEGVNELDVVEEGRAIRYSPRFKEMGTNVNFVAATKGKLNVRTYERGVENETYSCGTGVTASALAAAATGKTTGEVTEVETPGGKLKVYFKQEDKGFREIWLEGDATFVYDGEIEI